MSQGKLCKGEKRSEWQLMNPQSKRAATDIGRTFPVVAEDLGARRSGSGTPATLARE